MILTKVKSNRVFSLESLERCKNAPLSKPKCLKDECNGPSMGNLYCRWHGGANTEIQQMQKEQEKKIRRNDCHRKRRLLKKSNKNAYNSLMQSIQEIKGVVSNDKRSQDS